MLTKAPVVNGARGCGRLPLTEALDRRPLRQPTPPLDTGTHQVPAPVAGEIGPPPHATTTTGPGEAWRQGRSGTTATSSPPHLGVNAMGPASLAALRNALSARFRARHARTPGAGGSPATHARHQSGA